MTELLIASLLSYHNAKIDTVKDELRIIRQQNHILVRQNRLLKELKGLRK